jgi:hypothetical protein
MISKRAIRAVALGLSGLVLPACQSHEHAPPPGPASAGSGNGSIPDGGIAIDGHTSGGPPTCGGQTLEAIIHPPLLYFVIDRSGSMGDEIDASGVTKYAAALKAIGDLLDVVGSRVRYGAAIYPATNIDSSCEAGFQLFPPTLGDAVAKVPAGGRGPVLRELLNRLSGYTPGGATPTAATLRALAPRIQSFAKSGDPTLVLLLTDGAPNCNAATSCDSASCIPDIEAALIQQGTVCGRDFSCCDRSLDPSAGANCIDVDDSETAVRKLFDASVRSFVVGIPGSEAYEKTLERLAAAGGSARSTRPSYYAVSDADALSTAMLEIGTSISIPCEIELAEAPSDPALVNVYFDSEVVPRDAQEGWDYDGAAGLVLSGDSCRTLQSGGVRNVQIAYGCQTIVR